MPLVFYLRHQQGYWRPLAYVITAMSVVGAISSMSSGPWVMAIVAGICLLFERYKRWVRPVLLLVFLGCVLMGIASNRPFYHVIISYANPVGGTGWHRAKLVDLAIEHFGEWWFLGYGGEDPGWGQALGWMSWTDVTNAYVAAAVQFGLLGLVAFTGILVSSLLQLRRLYKASTDVSVRSLYWALGSIIVTLMIEFNATHIFAQVSTLYFCILAMVGSSPHMVLRVSTSTVFRGRLSHNSPSLAIRPSC